MTTALATETTTDTALADVAETTTDTALADVAETTTDTALADAAPTTSDTALGDVAATIADTAIADLVLVRMALPSKKPVTPKSLREDVGKLVGFDFSAAQLDEMRKELVSAGFLTKVRNTFALTDAGRERALRFLGIEEMPSSINWTTLIAKYLFPKAAGLSPDAAARLDNGNKLAAYILKRKYGLAGGAGSTVNQVLEAVACKELGFGDETTLAGLLCAVLSRLLGSERLTKAKLEKQLPLFETGLPAASANAARSKVVRDWLGVEPLAPRAPEPSPAEPFDLTAFAGTVRALAASSPPEDRFHDNKVFIAPLWRASQREPNFPRLELPEFKQRLVEANSQNLLHLSRADLVRAMDSQLVAESETEYLTATFHFVLLEGDQP